MCTATVTTPIGGDVPARLSDNFDGPGVTFSGAGGDVRERHGGGGKRDRGRSVGLLANVGDVESGAYGIQGGSPLGGGGERIGAVGGRCSSEWWGPRRETWRV
ncbi:hypothetical protein SSBG_05941 [Streptomyces sp. SPB074]|nr:hypothetical protein SSBG_05941 [Streptomyces sp. SPB074]